MSSAWPAGPAADQVEVSVFGPGIGESIAVHVGQGDWLIIDSCIEGRTNQHPTLRYLAEIGVDVAKQVRLVIATHAHDDHIAGISDVIRATPAAEVVVPEAATSAEFFALLSLDEENQLLGTVPSAYGEYRAINDILLERATGRGQYPAYNWAIADRTLWQRTSQSGIHSRVTALSPSSEAVMRSKAWVGAQLVPGAKLRRVTPDDPNTFGVALHVLVDDVAMIFGADLMTGPGKNCGWNAIVGSTTRPAECASLYKVAHHGSNRSEHDGIWSDLLVADPLAILTPFRPSRLPLPRDVARIRDRSGAAFASAGIADPAKPSRVRRAASELRAVAEDVRELDGLSGQVRARRQLGTTAWQVELRAPAVALL